jgi:spermidine/putrescine transport system permease protein
MFLSFAMSFDDVIISIFVTGVSVNTLPIKVYTQIKTGLSPKINALCTIMLAVSVLCLAIAGILKKIHRKYS